MKTADIFRKYNLFLINKILETGRGFHTQKTSVHDPIFNEPIKTYNDGKNEPQTAVKPTENRNKKPHPNLERLFYRPELQSN